MASLSKLADGRFRVEFYDADGRRKCVSLGTVSDRYAERFRDKITALAQVSRYGATPTENVARWLSGLNHRDHQKLVKAGLVKPRNIQTDEVPKAVLMEVFIDSYLERRTDLKLASVTVYRHVQRNLIGCFSPGRCLDTLTLGDGDEFIRFLKRQKLSPVTINRRLSLAKTILTAAVRLRLIEANPFSDLTAGSRSNSDPQRFITQETILRVIDAAPDAEWRLLIALGRFGGLRVPSEPLSLRWTDVDWQRERIRVWSPKTEHHDGKASREIPLFGELRPFLEEAFELAEPGSEFVISRHRPAAIQRKSGDWQNANLSTAFRRIIERAGVEPWPRLWNNLRSSRETELTQIPGLGLQAIVAWMGNSETVAMKHYLQTNDRDFDQAIQVTDSWLTENRSGTALHRARTLPQGENGGFDKPSQRKEKRPHAETCDRSIWRIEDTNRTFCRWRAAVGPCRNQPFISVFHRNCAGIISVAAPFIEMSGTHLSPAGGR